MSCYFLIYNIVMSCYFPISAMFDLSRDTDVSVTLYSRKVMVMSRASHILPKWLRFLKGIINRLNDNYSDVYDIQYTV